MIAHHQVQEDDVCTMCEYALLIDDRPLTMIESGRMEPMKKDPSFLKFVPDHSNADPDIAVDGFVDVLHTECLVNNIMDSWRRRDPLCCDCCGSRFLKEIPRWAFRLRIGGVALDNTFVADSDPANLAILCPSCFEEAVGSD